jgi:hypothetical protein
MPEEDVYHLQYVWNIEGPIDVVFYYIGHATTFPQWWTPVFLAGTSEDKEPYIGAKAYVKVKSILPYVLDWDLVVTRLEPPRLIELDSHVTLSKRFELTGSILYCLEEHGPIVRVISEQYMRPKKPIPKLFRPIARRLFKFNHRWAMRHGERGLQKVVRERAR